MPTLKRGTVCEVISDTKTTPAGTKVVVWGGDEYDNYYCQDLNGNYVGYVDVGHLRPLSGLDALKRGDVVVDVDGDKRTVLGVCGDVYLLSEHNNSRDYAGGYSIPEMRRLGDKPATPQEPADDATAEAMALLKSKGFKVVKETV